MASKWAGSWVVTRVDYSVSKMDVKRVDSMDG